MAREQLGANKDALQQLAVRSGLPRLPAASQESYAELEKAVGQWSAQVAPQAAGAARPYGTERARQSTPAAAAGMTPRQGGVGRATYGMSKRAADLPLLSSDVVPPHSFLCAR